MALMQQHSEIVYEHIIPYLNQCATTQVAMINCAERSREAGIGCWKSCRPTAEVIECIMKLISMNCAESAAFAELRHALCEMLNECNRICSQHSFVHCQRCSAEAGKLSAMLKEYSATPVAITSFVGM